ncbi:MAG TPA: hypothetical protein VNG93_12515 [Candidatus Dormibacteraeota bacterium]|nr:hypothetical protein [Candidatus Dormibacteraeota bacterium]
MTEQLPSELDGGASRSGPYTAEHPRVALELEALATGFGELY